MFWPKDARIRRRADFQLVYEKGFRRSGPYFSSVCLKVEGMKRGRVGFATPRSLGSSVIRNRVRRRLREAVRLNLAGLGPEWMVVIQARRPALEVPFENLRMEVEKLFSRCERS